MIFSRVSMIVDYRRFPDSIKHSMKSLREIHKDVQFSFDQTEELFTVNGKYTKIQAFSNDVMKMLGLENKNLKEHVSLQRNNEMDDGSKFGFIRNSEEVSCPLAEYKFETKNQKFKAKKQNQRFEAEKGDPKSKYETQNLRILEGNGLKAKYGNPGHEQDIEQLEDFSLVMDSDIYMYIQKFQLAEFQTILFKHEVEVVDVSSDGITTLYLQVGFETGNHIGTLTKAHSDLLHLYQRFEASLRKEQISKINLKIESKSLQRVPEEIQKLYPSLLCLEDDRCFYLIGNVIDLPQAKHYIQSLMTLKEVGKLVKSSELSLGSNSGTHQRTTSSGSSKESESDILLKKSSPTKSELKGEHKLAANFSHPKAEVSLLKTTSLVNEDSMRPSSIWSKEGDHQKNGEMLLSTPFNKEHTIQNFETENLPGADTGENEQKDPQLTDVMKGDISPKTPEISPSFSIDKCTHSLHSTGTRKNLGPTKPYSHDNALQYLSLYDTHEISKFLDSEHYKPKNTLKRSNSFSAGRLKEVSPPCPEINVKELSKVAKDSEIVDEMCLYTWLWSYMKDKSNITELCNGSGIQIAEVNMQDITILKIRADNKTKLDLIKQYLVSFYNRLSTEFTYQTFSYSELGVEGPHDEALSEWCHSLLGHCSKLRLKKLEHSLHLTYPKEAQLSIAEEHTKFITSRSKVLRYSSQLYATDKHKSRQHQTEEVYSSKPHSVPYSSAFVSDISDHQTYLDREETPGEMKSDSPRTSDSLDAFQGTEHEEDSSGPKELLILNSDDVEYNMTTENGASLREVKAFQEGSKEALIHPRDQVRPENGGIEMDVSKVKKTLPNKFQFLKNKSKGGLQDETGNQRSGIRLWEGSPHSLPTGLYNTQQNFAGLKMLNEQSGFISKLSLGGQINVDKSFFPNHGAEEETAAKPQLRHPNIGQETVEKKARNCDQCKKGDTGTATAHCGHSFCRNCFSASEDTCIACSHSSPVGAQHTVRGTMTQRILSSSVMGYYQDPTIKIIYDILDGVQGPADPNPESRYTGGRFEAFLPDNREGRKLLTLLERALDQGLTFKIQPHPSGDNLTWNIPHKTSQQGGKSKNGYPDAQYFGNVFRKLKEYGIE
uniref:RING-type E3 ubiquitin transferase n=1 Tax=Geotrypetes seraphini TaxID=260995 RepID=A0A6P8NSU2_GEOSA|nr:uncharacterized protein LOC117347304 isoform X2 [Geotrypetes seraphini]